MGPSPVPDLQGNTPKSYLTLSAATNLRHQPDETPAEPEFALLPEDAAFAATLEADIARHAAAIARRDRRAVERAADRLIDRVWGER